MRPSRVVRFRSSGRVPNLQGYNLPSEIVHSGCVLQELKFYMEKAVDAQFMPP